MAVTRPSAGPTALAGNIISSVLRSVRVEQMKSVCDDISQEHPMGIYDDEEHDDLS